MTYDNIKSHKKSEFPLSLEDRFFEKPKGMGQTDPPPAVLGLILVYCFL